MEQRSLKVLGADKTFFGKVSNVITKLLIPTRVGLNSLMIKIKRNSLLKCYEYYKSNDNATNNQRYEESYALYLEAIDKYIMDSIYKKVKNGAATEFESNALTQYYKITALKDTEYMEYKYRKQKYLLELDYETIMSISKTIAEYEKFYIEKIDNLYKGILKNYSVKLADKISRKLQRDDDVYERIFDTLEEYISEILPIKIKANNEEDNKKIVESYDEFSKFESGKLNDIDIIEKNMILLGISRNLFTHSLPLIAAEQCYIKLLKDTRNIITTSSKDKQKAAYEMLIKLIEDYNIRLLSTKVYWDNPKTREEYKEFWKEYQSGKEEKDKEILFLRYELRLLGRTKKDYSKIKSFYRKKLVEYGVMKTLKNTCKTLEYPVCGIAGTWKKGDELILKTCAK